MGAARALVVHCGRLIFGVRECGSLCVYVALPVKVKGTLRGQRYRRGRGGGLALCETRRAAPQTDVVFTEAPRGRLGAAGGFNTFVATSAWPRVGALCGARHNAAFADVASSEGELGGGLSAFVGQCLGNDPTYAV